MTFLEAAVAILRDVAQPLSINDITRLALERGLLDSIGKTPRQIMAVVISQSLRREREGIELSPIVRVERGLYGLRSASEEIPLGRHIDYALFRQYGEFLEYKDAAYEVLNSEGRALSYGDIAQLALEWGLINPQGMMPAASLSAQLYRDIQLNGVLSRFRLEAPGVFGLSEWQFESNLVVGYVRDQLVRVKRQLLGVLGGVDPFAFEVLVSRLLGKLGYSGLVITTRIKDEGIDILADIHIGILQLHTAIQVKRTKTNIGRPVVSQFRGDMLALQNIDQGMIITTSGFTRGAMEIARLPNTTPIILIDGDKLTDLMIEHRIGVRVEEISLVTFDSDSLMIEYLSE